uniref:NADH-ubiquinone oxidoreductase chain 2 n=1 Tax=Anthicidae sp. 1 ACP-2013 TaxID=1434426 RepID=A0A3G5FNH2_9CUCU|nr:NADH dehydrogenase subunit 2 [Anthicidae sp. 1 ACP-2013]
MYKIVFFNSMVMGTIISISSYSWMGMWMGLEINLLSIIPLLSSPKNMYSSESSLKYFITQALASLILLFSIIMMLMWTESVTPQMDSSMLMMMNSALMTKLGAAPFHFWFTEVMEGLSWMNCSILLTWQKIAPMILIMNNKMMLSFIIPIIILSLTISSIMSLNQVSLRKIMAFSSINHMAWMLAAMSSSFQTWTIYLMVYMIITLNLTYMFNLNKTFYINQLMNFLNQNKTLKFSVMINFLSLGGLPPFLGFLPKWLTINSLAQNNMFTISVILIMLTLIMLFVYIRLLTSSMIIQHSEMKSNNSQINKFTFLLINFLTLSSLITCTFLAN